MRRIRLAAVVVVGSLLLPMQPAVASCAEGYGPDGSPVIFVGTAGSERRGYTSCAVDEVRVGPGPCGRGVGQSGQEQPPWPLSLLSAVGSSGNADFIDGEPYVVGASQSFVTDVCSITEADARTRSTSARACR
jgi:hypothetical protein